VTKLRNMVVILGLLITVALVPVQAVAEVPQQATSASERPALHLWDAAVEWVAGWFTAATADGEPTDPEVIEPLAPLGPGGGDQATTSTNPNGGEIGPGLDPNG